MASTARIATAPAAQLALVIPPRPEVFNDAFIERRMRDHRDWCAFVERITAAGIIHESSTGAFNQPGPRLVGK